MADRVTLTQVMGDLYLVLYELTDDGVTVWPGPPRVEGRLPAAWLEALLGGGTNVRDRPATVRIVYVPAPSPDPDVMWPRMWEAVDRLDDLLEVLPGGLTCTSRAWTFDTVAPGDVTRDALLYDLALTYPAC